jgi:hypothetical protein
MKKFLIAWYSEMLWLIHNIFIHPIAGILWAMGFEKFPNWLHDSTVPFGPLGDPDKYLYWIDYSVNGAPLAAYWMKKDQYEEYKKEGGTLQYKELSEYPQVDIEYIDTVFGSF